MRDMTPNPYLEMIERSFRIDMGDEFAGQGRSKLSWLADYIFNVTTYDDAASEYFGGIIVEVCDVILNKKQSEYIFDTGLKVGNPNYVKYLAVANLPFVSEITEWGTSVRCAWFCGGKVEPRSLYDHDGKQITELQLDYDQAGDFIRAVIDFAKS